MSSDESWTIGKLLTWTADYLQQHGSESPQLDAQLLLAHARKCRRIDLFTAYSAVASETERKEFRDLLRQRAAGTPVAYLVGHREFFSLDFQVTRDVLIPRPETEFVVLALLDLVKEFAANSTSLAIADVGTGSGILAACGAKHISQARVWATDISQRAIDVAADNCRAHGVAERVEFYQGDLLTPLPAALRLDFIVSNPPYVSESEYGELARDVRDFEPRQALVAGPRGVEIIERLVAQAGDRLTGNGWLLIEISPMIEEAVHRIITASGRFTHSETIRDLAGHARVVKAVTPR